MSYRELSFLAEITGPFALAWGGQAGSGSLERPRSRGRAGLWVVDTRDWSVRPDDSADDGRAPRPTRSLVTESPPAGGITVYRPDGTPLRALTGRRVTGVGVTARYAYVDATGGRYPGTMKRTDRRPTRASKARLVLPDLLDLP